MVSSLVMADRMVKIFDQLVEKGCFRLEIVDG